MKRIIILAITGICICFHVTAGNISLEQARTLALAASRSLAKYNLAVQSSVLDERAQFYTNLPSLSLGGSASMNIWESAGSNSGGSSGGSAGGSSDGSASSINAGINVSVSQKIFAGGKSAVQQAISRLTTESARRDALAEYFNVLDTVDTAYYAVLQAAADLESAESTLQTYEVSLSTEEVRQASGMITRGDFLKALADKESNETTRNQARRNLSLSITKLKALTGLSENPNPEQVDFSGYEDLIQHLGNISDTEADSLYKELWKTVTMANPSLAKAAITNQKAEKNLSLAMRDYLPSISASFSTGFNIMPGTGLSAGQLSLSASIPLDFWVTANTVSKNKIAKETAALDYASAQSTLETDLETALLDTISQAGSVLSSRRALEYAEKHFEYIMERYRLSLSPVSELSDASALVSSSRGQSIKARYGFLQNLSKLRSLGAFEDEEKLMRILLGNKS
jgi:outer membrane protein TolC